MGKDVVKCANCAHARPMITYDNIVVRCMVLKIGKVKNSNRICSYYESSENNQNKGNRPQKGKQG